MSTKKDRSWRQHGSKNLKIAECRQCRVPVLENSEGVVTERALGTKGWCFVCMKEAVPLMAHISRVATGDQDLEDFIKAAKESCPTDIVSSKLLTDGRENTTLDSALNSLDVCPDCGDNIVHGAFFDACRKCSPMYFEKCEECTQLKVNCICK